MQSAIVDAFKSILPTEPTPKTLHLPSKDAGAESKPESAQLPSKACTDTASGFKSGSASLYTNQAGMSDQSGSDQGQQGIQSKLSQLKSQAEAKPVPLPAEPVQASTPAAAVFQNMPAGSQCLPDGCQRLPSTSQDLPSDSPSLPITSQAMPPITQDESPRDDHHKSFGGPPLSTRASLQLSAWLNIVYHSVSAMG